MRREGHRDEGRVTEKKGGLLLRRTGHSCEDLDNYCEGGLTSTKEGLLDAKDDSQKRRANRMGVFVLINVFISSNSSIDTELIIIIS
jgi:hypothetical protein